MRLVEGHCSSVTCGSSYCDDRLMLKMSNIQCQLFSSDNKLLCFDLYTEIELYTCRFLTDPNFKIVVEIS